MTQDKKPGFLKPSFQLINDLLHLAASRIHRTSLNRTHQKPGADRSDGQGPNRQEKGQSGTI